MTKVEKEIREEAIKKIREQMEGDFQEGYERAYLLVAGGEIDLLTAEELCNADEPNHEEFEGETEAYIKGFISALREILSAAEK